MNPLSRQIQEDRRQGQHVGHHSCVQSVLTLGGQPPHQEQTQDLRR